MQRPESALPGSHHPILSTLFPISLNRKLPCPGSTRDIGPLRHPIPTTHEGPARPFPILEARDSRDAGPIVLFEDLTIGRAGERRRPADQVIPIALRSGEGVRAATITPVTKISAGDPIPPLEDDEPRMGSRARMVEALNASHDPYIGVTQG